MSDDATPAKVRLTDGLGVASHRAMFEQANARQNAAWWLMCERMVAAERERWEPALRALLSAKWCTPEYEQACRAAAALLKA